MKKNNNDDRTKGYIQGSNEVIDLVLDYLDGIHSTLAPKPLTQKDFDKLSEYEKGIKISHNMRLLIIKRFLLSLRSSMTTEKDVNRELAMIMTAMTEDMKKEKDDN